MSFLIEIVGVALPITFFSLAAWCVGYVCGKIDEQRRNKKKGGV